MHIPDGLLNAPTLAGTAALSAAALGLGSRLGGGRLSERRVPAMGVMAAFIFAAQMINFPVAGGTSGHFLGAALAAVALGPWAASLVMTAVLAVQCLLFADGGLLALGANVFNMAVVGPWAGWAVYRALVALVALVALGGAAARRGGGAAAAWRAAAGFIAAWASVVLAAAAAAVELALGGAVPLRVAVPAMLSWHVLIGVGEGAITAVALVYVAALRPGEAAEGGVKA